MIEKEETGNRYSTNQQYMTKDASVEIHNGQRRNRALTCWEKYNNAIVYSVIIIIMKKSSCRKPLGYKIVVKKLLASYHNQETLS